jgi:hypothetical protein
LVTLTTTESLALTTVPGGGSTLTTVQFAGNRTMLYFGFADDSVTSDRPSLSRLCSAILAFCPVTSGIVIEAPEVAAVGGALASTEGTLDAGFVTVTVDAVVEVLLPQAANVSAMAVAATAAANLSLTLPDNLTVTATLGHRRGKTPLCEEEPSALTWRWQ